MHNNNTNVMKKVLSLLLLLWVPAVMMAQGYSKYKSREEDEYNRNHKTVRMQPLTIEDVKHCKTISLISRELKTIHLIMIH